MSLFATAGRRSRREVCVDLIRELPEKDPISDGVALTEIEERTGASCDRRAALAAMWEATEWLHRHGEPGVERVDGGWVRLDARGMMRYAHRRSRRGENQLKRRTRAAVIADPDQLDGQEKLKREFYLHADRRQTEIEEQRTRRRRPIASGE